MSELEEQLTALRRDPGNEAAADAVRRLARASGSPRVYAEAFVGRGVMFAAKGRDDDAVKALVEAAQAYEEEVEDPSEAASVWQRVLDLDGEHRRALFSLSVLLHDLGRTGDLIALYRRRLEGSDDDGERTTMHFYISELLSEKLGDHSAAFDELLKAARLAPRTLRTISRLEKLGERTGRLGEVAVVIGDLILHQEDTRLRAALALRLAELHMGPLDDRTRALAYYRSALLDDGGNPELLSEVEDAFRERKRFEELAELLEQVATDRRVGSQRVRLERELARIYELELGDVPRALAAVGRAAREAPEDRELIDEVLRLGLASDDMTAVAAIFEEVAARSRNPLLVTYLRLKLGHFYANLLSRPDDARRVYGDILSDDPGHAEARRRLDRLPAPAKDAKDGRRILDIRADEVDAARAVVEPAPEETPFTGEVYGPETDTAFAHEGLAEPAEVFSFTPEETALPAAAETAPITPPVIAAPVVTAAPPAPGRLPAEVDERLLELQQSLQDVTRTGDKAAKVRILEEIVSLAESYGQHERAFFAMVRLVRAEPTAERASALVRLGAIARSHAELIPTYEEIAPRLDLTAQIQLGLRVAEIEAEDMLDGAAALKRVAALHELDPDEPEVFQHWVDLLAREGRYETLAEVHETEARRVIDLPTARGLSMQAAEIRERHLGDASAAADALIAYLHRAPDDERVRTGAARLLEAAARWSDLAKLLEEDVYRYDGKERAALRRRIAAIYNDRLHDTVSAERMLRLALAEQPREQETVEQLVRIYEDCEQWQELVDALASQIAIVRGARARAAIRRRIASVAERRLKRPDLALQHLDEAVREDPADLEAMADIERLRRAAEDWGGVAEVLVLRSHALGDPRDRADTLVEIARLRQTALNDLTGAAQAYRDALALFSEHQAALDEYATLAERTGEYTAAVDALRDLAFLLEKREQADVYTRIGRILETHLGQLEEAAFEYQLAVDADPDCLDAISRLRRYRETKGQDTQAFDLCRREAQLTRDDRKRAALWVKAAELARHRVGDTQAAIECYERGLDADPEDLSTEAVLGELYLATGEAERAYPHLARAARGLQKTDAQRAHVLHVGAGEAAEKLDMAAEAIAAYESALALSPKARAPLSRLAVLLEAAGDFEKAYEFSATLILYHELALGPMQCAPVYLRMARAKRALGDLPAAVRLARKAQGLAPAETAPLALLADALGEEGQSFEAAECLKRLASMTADAEERLAILVRASRAYLEEANDAARAQGLLVDAHAIDPASTEVADLLATCRERLGDFHGAAEALAATARKLSGRTAAELLVRAARIVAGPGRDRPKGRALLSEATSIVPTHREGYRELAVMLEFDGLRLELAQLAERAARSFLEDESTALDTDEGRTAAALRCLEEAKRLYRHRLKRPEDALRIVKMEQALVPQDEAVREERARLLDAAAQKTNGKEREALQREAVAVWSELVEARPGHLDGLRRLQALRNALGMGRVARVTGEILVAVGEATEFERREFSHEDGEEVAPTPKALLDVRPEIPAHPAESSALAELFALLGYTPLEAFDDALIEPKLKKKDRIELTQLGTHVGDALGHAGLVLRVEAPPVYGRDDAPGVVVPTYFLGKPSLVVSLAMAAKTPTAELRFHMARALSLLRPRSLALAALPLEVLREGIEGLVRESVAAGLLLSEPKAIAKRGRALEKALSPDVREDVVARVKRWIESPNRSTLFDEREAVLRSADRAGLVASGSLLASVRALQGHGRVDRTWFLPLVEYSATRGYASLVERFG